MDYQLVIVQGRSSSQVIRLGEGITTVGRQDGCDLKINSSQVSRKHCQLFDKKGLLLVKDLGSSNGTFVNGKRIKDQRVLEPGDELTIGQVMFRVEKVSAAAPTAASKPGDTAVAQSPAPPPAEGDVFEIDFEDAAAEIALADDTEATQIQHSAPEAPASKAKAPEPPEAKAPAPETPPPPPKPEPKPEIADEAVADFLMELKLDDEDED